MTRRNRQTNDAEGALFRDMVRDVRPLKAGRAKPIVSQAAVSGNLRKAELLPKPKFVMRTMGPSGLDRRTAEKLRRGRLEPEACLDLHGMTEAAAHRALTRFIHAARAKAVRLVLVITGKGSEPAPCRPSDMEFAGRSRGVLMTMAPRWIAEPELARFIADVRPAHRRHGGDGALYIYLRKP